MVQDPTGYYVQVFKSLGATIAINSEVKLAAVLDLLLFMDWAGVITSDSWENTIISGKKFAVHFGQT